VLRVLPEQGGADAAIELAIASHGLSHAFPPEALAEARQYGREVALQGGDSREDLRKLPLVTIDGEDARDFDDAVFAEPNPAGFRLVVAIADVSQYVRPGTALDAEARHRATSVYFPSRVLPMLPEELSNHLCSLMPDVDRLCMVCDMQVTRTGALSKGRFYPSGMRSPAPFSSACARVKRSSVIAPRRSLAAATTWRNRSERTYAERRILSWLSTLLPSTRAASSLTSECSWRTGSHELSSLASSISDGGIITLLLETR
jgi:VacB/RNase II family 3'-5' exoribonuclease